MRADVLYMTRIQKERFESEVTMVWSIVTYLGLLFNNNDTYGGFVCS